MLQKSSMSDVLEVFFEEPSKKHYLMEISKKSKLAHTSVKKYLKELKRKNIIREEVERKGTRKFPLFIANLDNNQYKKNKKIHNLLKLIESGLIEFLKDNLMPKSIVLFGSYQRGENSEDSDIDIFVECKKEKLDLTKFKKLLKRNIQLHFKGDFKKYPKELKNNIINGVILEGYLEAY